MAVGHRLDCFMRHGAAKGAGRYCYWASQFTAVYQSGTQVCHLPVSPVYSAATGGRPQHPGLETAFPMRDGGR